MHKNNTQQQDNCSPKDFSLEPITLTYNKRLLDHKKNEIMFNQSMKKNSKQDYFNQNQQLICQLYSLIENEEVKKNMNEQLMDRVQKILNDTQIQSSNNYFPGFSEDQKSSVSKSWKRFEDKEKNSNQGLREKNSIKNNLEKDISNFEIIRSQNLFSHKKTCRSNKQNYEHRGTFNLKKDSQNLRVKNKKIMNTQNSQSKNKQKKANKRLKSLQNENRLTYVSSSKKLQNKIKLDNMSIGQTLNREYKEVRKKQKQVQQRSQQKNNSNKAQKSQSNLKYPYSLNTTIFTTRNLQEDIKKQKKQNFLQCKSSQKQKKGNSKKIIKNEKDNIEQIRHLTQEQQYEEEKDNLFRTGTSSDQQLFSSQGNEKIKIKKDKRFYNENLIQSHSLLGQVYSKQFIGTICKLQKDAVNQEEQLQRKIKELKILISSENSAIQIKRVSISKMKEEQSIINANNGLILNKKKQVHKKLESMWGQVKLLNSNILQIQKQNSQIKASVDQEKQLISMYTTVIEELKEQLKIEVDYRDEYKKKLNFSKKNQLVSKMKANCTKGQTQLIMNNIRDSIGKWIS